MKYSSLMKKPLNVRLPKFIKLEYLPLFIFFILIFVGFEIPKLIYWIVINNALLVLLINLENGKRTSSEFLQPKLITYLVCIINVFILYRVL